MIRIINYDAGNILNVDRAFRQLGVASLITSDLSFLDRKKDILVLPGVGSFGATMQSLNDLGLTEKIKEHILGGGKFLGICLGLQLLYEQSAESKGVKGLGILQGTIEKFPNDVCGKVPQIGWNNIQIEKPFFKDFNDKYFYFVHSYYASYKKEICLASTEYGLSFNSGVLQDNLIAVQFHPEKSGNVGLNFLQKVIEYFTI
jgi:glutamine amidotransferase